MSTNNNGDAESPDAEIVEAGPVENGPANHSQSQELERIATYSIEEGGILYQLYPLLTSLDTKWVIRAYGSASGPMRFEYGISDEQAEDLGLSPQTQRDLNATLQRAKEVAKLPRSLRGQQRQKRTLNDLQENLEME